MVRKYIRGSLWAQLASICLTCWKCKLKSVFSYGGLFILNTWYFCIQFTSHRTIVKINLLNCNYLKWNLQNHKNLCDKTIWQDVPYNYLSTDTNCLITQYPLDIFTHYMRKIFLVPVHNPYFNHSVRGILPYIYLWLVTTLIHL